MMNLDYRRITVATFEGLLIAYLILLILDYSDPGFVSFYIHLDYLLYLVIAFGVASFLSYTQEIEKSKLDGINRYVTISFLCLLSLFILNGIFYFAFLETYQTHLMITVIAFGVISFWLNRDEITLKEETKPETGEDKKRFFLVRWVKREGWFCSIVLMFLIGFGGYLRFMKLGVLSLWADEAYTALASLGILRTGIPFFPSGEIYIISLLHNYIVALSMLVLGVNEFAIRFPSAIFGTITIAFVYFMGKENYNSKIGLIAATLIAFTFYEMIWARDGRMYQQLQLFYLIASYFYLKWTLENKKNYLFLAILFFGIAFLTHRFAIIFVVVTLIHLFTRLYRNKLKNYNPKICFALLFIFCIFALLAFIFMDYIQLFHVPKYAQREVLYYITFLFRQSSLAFSMALLGIILSLIKRDNQGPYFTLSFCLPIILLTLFPWKESRFLYFLYPFYILLASSAIFTISRVVIYNIKFFTKSQSKNDIIPIKKIVSLIFIILFIGTVIPVIPLADYYFGREPPPRGIDVRDWRGAIEDISKHMRQNDVIVSTLPAVTYFYIGRTDFWLRESVFYVESKQKDSKYYDIYVGSEILKNKTELEKLIDSSERGWLILDSLRLKWYTSNKTRNFIKQNLDLYSDNYKNIEIYSWGIFNETK